MKACFCWEKGKGGPFFLSVILCIVSMGIRLPGPGGAAATRNGFACAVPGSDTGYPLQERLTGSRHTARATTATAPLWQSSPPGGPQGGAKSSAINGFAEV